MAHQAGPVVDPDLKLDGGGRVSFARPAGFSFFLFFFLFSPKKGEGEGGRGVPGPFPRSPLFGYP